MSWAFLILYVGTHAVCALANMLWHNANRNVNGLGTVWDRLRPYTPRKQNGSFARMVWIPVCVSQVTPGSCYVVLDKIKSLSSC